MIGGYTQFLTQAQGLPPHIENALIKLTRDFIWEENKSPRITLDYLYYLPEEGGLNLRHQSEKRSNRNHVVERIPKPIAIETFMSENNRRLHRRGSTTILQRPSKNKHVPIDE